MITYEFAFIFLGLLIPVIFVLRVMKRHKEVEQMKKLEDDLRFALEDRPIVMDTLANPTVIASNDSLPAYSPPALKKAAMERFPIAKYGGIVEKESHPQFQRICTLCSGIIHEGTAVRDLPCRHFFHARCIDYHLLSRSGSCPICNMNFHLGHSAIQMPDPAVIKS
ncbi:RING-H2 finger protein ATL72 [Zancudomyces culisetae]|uniref:RING-H2 finger protein ATL72 n=1 Tax=Zancudomyces culisetae TaxID=1213189 RepID=A0A1R1PLH7_ZANCU|nr:RING-H2 finger protein ATL72 [Zancudomyces culisetae]|eukprot:OMH81789.1 RING-H2 finger protein ATL72 [Zancudomyces culisetae]